MDKDAKVATFLDKVTNQKTEQNFDLLHIVPHQEAPDFLKKSPIVDKFGYVDIHKETLQHVKFPNIYSIGDCSNLPTSKTAAAVIT